MFKGVLCETFIGDHNVLRGYSVGRKKVKIVPNKIFYTLWMDTDSSSLDSFVKKYTSPFSNDRILFQKKYDLNLNEVNLILKNIYILKTKSFRELLEESNMRKADISKIFCIPIRTIEDWYAERNRCPLYVKLMIIKEYRLLDLGKYIYLESEIDYQKRKHPVYQKRKHQEPKVVNSSISGIHNLGGNIKTSYNLPNPNKRKREYLPYEDYLRRKRMEKETKQ